jgi:hypothetical protein
MGMRRETRKVGPDDVIESNVDLMNVPRATVVVGDHYAMWARRVK